MDLTSDRASSRIRQPEPRMFHTVYATVARIFRDREKATSQIIALRERALSFIDSDHPVTVYRGEGLNQLVCTSGPADGLEPEELLSKRVAHFLRECVFVHTNISSVRVCRRSLELDASRPIMWRLIERHVMAGVDALNAAA